MITKLTEICLWKLLLDGINIIVMITNSSTQEPFNRLEYFKQWLKDNPDKARQYRRNYEATEASKEYRKKLRNTTEHKAYMKEYRRRNKERISARSKEYVNGRKEIIKARHHERYYSDPQYKLALYLRAGIYRALRGASAERTERSEALLGCTIEEFRKHIESLWLPGMNWDNHTKKGWHIDHIRPCASYDLTDLKQQKECFHYSNQQPLWGDINISKNSIYEGKRYYYSPIISA